MEGEGGEKTAWTGARRVNGEEFFDRGLRQLTQDGDIWEPARSGSKSTSTSERKAVEQEAG